jgi:hypothetical protein
LLINKVGGFIFDPALTPVWLYLAVCCQLLQISWLKANLNLQISECRVLRACKVVGFTDAPTAQPCGSTKFP